MTEITHEHYLVCGACVLEDNQQGLYKMWQGTQENLSVIVNLAVSCAL